MSETDTIPSRTVGEREMKAVKDSAAVTDSGIPRRPWTAPGTRRLMTSAAEANAAGGPDATELLS
jgi:hypothetical protein